MCEDKLKGKTNHFRLPSASKRRACLSSLFSQGRQPFQRKKKRKPPPKKKTFGWRSSKTIHFGSVLPQNCGPYDRCDQPNRHVAFHLTELFFASSHDYRNQKNLFDTLLLPKGDLGVTLNLVPWNFREQKFRSVRFQTVANCFLLYSYLAMTTWFCVSSETTTLTVAGLVVLYCVFYFLMERKHSDTSPRSRKEMKFEYEKIPDDGKTDVPTPVLLTREAKLQALKEICPSILFVVISWGSEFLVMQAVITTYAFPNSPFPPRDHYQYYITLFLLGEFIGRSHLAAVSFIKEELVPKVMIRKLWALTIIELCILIFCLFATWYRFLPDISTLLVLSFLAGLVIGIMYANVLQVFTESYEYPLREFVLGFVAVATGMGIFIAGLLGLVVEPLFRRHCLTITDLAEYCFTRTTHNAGANVTTSCHKR